jgi:SAM-dependent methyltransferase
MKKYFRDIWALGPPSGGYPGAFPRGLITRIKKRWWGKKRLWLFSGSYSTNDITVDINNKVKPKIQANCEHLPFLDETFDFVFADPPYSKEESMKLYQLPYVNIIKTLNEMVRVCKPGGYLLFLHRIVPEVFPGMNLNKDTHLEGIVGVFTIAGMSNMRALSIRRRNNILKEEYESIPETPHQS